MNIHKLPTYCTTKANPNRISKVKVIQATFSDHNAINLEVDNKSLAKQPTKNRTTWEFLNNILIYFLDKKEIKEEGINKLEMKDSESLFISKLMVVDKTHTEENVTTHIQKTGNTENK